MPTIFCSRAMYDAYFTEHDAKGTGQDICDVVLDVLAKEGYTIRPFRLAYIQKRWGFHGRRAHYMRFYEQTDSGPRCVFTLAMDKEK